jgi:selenium-binding protein 1
MKGVGSWGRWRAAEALARLLVLAVAAAAFGGIAGGVRADEASNSPYVPNIVGQEDFVYVWTLGVEGLGDGSDKLVTLGANPELPHYGEVVASASVGGRHGAHHGGFTDDRRQLWVGGIDDSRIFIFDVASDPANPELIHTIRDFPERSGGVVGPYRFTALPGAMLISGLSNTRDGGPKSGLVEYSNHGEFVRTTWMPEGAVHGGDARVNPRLNRMLTGSFVGRNTYTRDLRELMANPEALERFGGTVVLWDLHSRKPLQILAVPGAPAEIRWAHRPRHDYAFAVTALASKLWGLFRNDDGTYEARALADVGDPAERPLPVDLSLSSNDRYLFVTSFRDGTVRVFDVDDPREPDEVLAQRIGSQLASVAQSWDGERVYFSSSQLPHWDGRGESEEQFVRAYGFDGKDLEPRFEVDFVSRGLGNPHGLFFGSLSFYRGRVARVSPDQMR